MVFVPRMPLAIVMAAASGLAAGQTPGVDTAAGGKQVFGYIEEVMLDPERGFTLGAKLDTGADNSSLDARDMRRVRRGEELLVRFTVRDPMTGEPVVLLKPYVRRVRIKRHNGEYQRRFVVRMTICLGPTSRSIEVNLIDREHFEYPMLLGRSALEGIAVVDPSRRNTQRPDCWKDDQVARRGDTAPPYRGGDVAEFLQQERERS